MSQDQHLSTGQGNLPWYFGGHGAWYVAAGLQMVLFPYLSAFVLGLDARYIGISQLALMGPGLILLMPGGVIADHLDERGYLIRLHILASLPPLVMASVLFTGHLSFGFLIAYAVLAGSLSTLATPARDSLLNHLVPHDQLNRLIAMATAIQFGGQLVGMGFAGLAQFIGPAPFFIVHSMVMLGGAYSLRQISLARHDVAHTPLGVDLRVYARHVGDAVAFLFKSRILAPVMICNSAVGFFFVGSFMVSVPIFVRDVFHGSAFDISQLHISFFLGTVISALIIMRVGTIVKRGRLMILGLSAGAAICFLMSLSVPFYLFAALMFGWGLGAGAVMTTSRTIIQEAAPENMRARLLASFQMGIMGFGPLGSLVTGFVISAVGVRQAMLVPGIGMTVVLGLVVIFSGLRTLTNADTAK
jgi:MFS family permease